MSCEQNKVAKLQVSAQSFLADLPRRLPVRPFEGTEEIARIQIADFFRNLLHRIIRIEQEMMGVQHALALQQLLKGIACLFFDQVP